MLTAVYHLVHVFIRLQFILGQLIVVINFHEKRVLLVNLGHLENNLEVDNVVSPCISMVKGGAEYFGDDPPLRNQIQMEPKFHTHVINSAVSFLSFFFSHATMARRR